MPNSLPRNGSHSADQQFDELVEEITRKLQGGESVDVDQFVRQAPMWEERLRRMWPGLMALAQLSCSSASEDLSIGNGELPTDPINGVLGDFRLIREIGRGGMGVVYEAQQISLRRRVALKVLPMAGMLDPRQLQRFQNEAQAAASLHHTNIVPVFSVGCERGVHYYAMQYIEGRSLAEVIAELRTPSSPSEADDAPPLSHFTSQLVTAECLAEHVEDSPDLAPTVVYQPGQEETDSQSRLYLQPPSKAAKTTQAIAGVSTQHPGYPARSRDYIRNIAQLGIQIAEALDYAHSLGITHRDIKPSNLILDGRGTVWIADFGLAQVGTEGNLTLTGELLGTLRYMSPEQARGQRGVLDQRTDIYSLGITLYELFTLEPAFPSTDRKELLQQLLNEEPQPPRATNPALPRDLETILLKAIAKEPGSRYASARELAEDFKRFLGDQPIQAKRPGLIERTSKWSRRHRALVVTAIALILFLSTAGTGISLAWVEQERQATLRERSARKEAEENLLLAKEAVDKYLNAITEEPQLKQDNFHGLRKKLVESALPFYERFVERKTDDPEMQAARGQAFARLGKIQSVLSQFDEAQGNYHQMQAVFSELLTRFPENPEYQAGLAKSYRGLGHSLLVLGKPTEAVAALEQAIELYFDLEEQHPEVVDYQLGLANAYQGLGTAWLEMEKMEHAKIAYMNAVMISRLLNERFPGVTEHQKPLASNLGNLGLVLNHLGDFDAARAAIEESIHISRALVKQVPQELEYQEGLALELISLGAVVHHGLQETDKARAAFEEAVEISRRLVKNIPAVRSYKDTLLLGLNNLGITLEAMGDFEEAEIVKEEWHAVVLSMEKAGPSKPTITDKKGGPPRVSGEAR